MRNNLARNIIIAVLVFCFSFALSLKEANAQCIFNIADWSESGVTTCLENGGVIGLVGTVGNWGENYRRTAQIVQNYNNGKQNSDMVTIEVRLYNDSRPHTAQEIQSAIAMMLSYPIGTNPIIRINNEPTDSYAWAGLSYEEKIEAIAQTQYAARQAINQAGGGILLASEMLDMWNGENPQNVWAAVTQYIQSHQSEFPGVNNYHDLYDVYSISGYFNTGNFGVLGNNNLADVLSSLPLGKAWRFSEFGYIAPGARPTYEINNLRQVLTEFVAWLANNPSFASNFAGFGIFTKDPHQSTSDIAAAIMQIIADNPGLGSALAALDIFGVGDPAKFQAWLQNLLTQGVIVACKDISGNLLGYAPDQNACNLQFGNAPGSSCGGPIDLDQVGFKAEMALWRFTAKFNAKEIDDGDLYSASNYIKSNFVLETVNSYPHFNLEPFANQLVGSKVEGTQNVATRVEDFKAPTQLSSRVPGKIEPSGFSIGPQEYQRPDENEEDYTKRVFDTSTSSLGQKEKYGEKAEMKVTNFKACIQRLTCNPAVEKCLKESYLFNSQCPAGQPNCHECVDGVDNLGDGSGCISYGKVFTLGGKLSFEEPADLLTVSKSLDNLGKKYSDIKDENSSYAKAKSQKNLLVNNVNYNAYTPQQVQAQVTKVKAADPSGSLNSSITLGASSNGSGYNVNYRYCIGHQSPCGMGDLRSVINGTQINLWKSTTSDDPNDACLEPGWGGAPSFDNVSLPFTVTVTTGGNRTGPQGICPDSDTQSCTISEVNGVLTTTCGGTLPPPPPVDCRNCPSWAPASACAKIVKQTLPTVNECSDGKCQSGIRDVEEQVPLSQDVDINFSFSGIPVIGTLFNAIGLNEISCQRESSSFCTNRAPCALPDQGACPCTTWETGGNGKWQCAFNAAEYALYAYPTSNLIGDYGNKTSYIRPLEAIFKVPGQTDKYFTKESAMSTVSLKLKPEDIDIQTSGQFYIDAQKDAKYFRIKEGDTKKINVEYYDFYQPLYSSICLADQFTRVPNSASLDYQDNCNSFAFYPGNRNGAPLDSLDPTTPITFSGNVESDIATAAGNNGVPAAVLKAILEVELGSVEFDPNNYTCTRNSATATGPMQITDGTVFGYLRGTEPIDWNIKTWNAGEDFSSDGRCHIEHAMEIAARILKGKADYAVSQGWVTDSADFMYNPQMAIYASGGYYGTRQCNPTAETQNRWGQNISYCDFFIYKVGQYGGYPAASPQICQTLKPTCDGVGPFNAGEGAQSGPTQGTKTEAPVSQGSSSPVTNPKGDTQTQKGFLIDVQNLMNKYKDQIKSTNPTINDLPPAMVEEIKALAQKYKN
ncbi:hypothetical protein CO058_03310 [candidate division WWE3 bacterium CG_4_9_14_0_2_um_filter_35_11]|uniref:Uncharacterized protein n=1 Tax=candidate division WWE3 bacterium CG_4_9_14_0_2_um_filter_35_11 TaxID=1975077 RepID=A0A2M8EL43_UNCKA|nr:MAG: hypothetical protein COV25_00705 [candidate division WWE3 bacterium CG10_big_fil_rev_8_21_14_0_10_35_32]PJC23435.1 MAG: hypothetical protein CO058_03310 [candidate division WWE3 bacterium CG_4_9_14_0_2_um_filter_35_11]